MASGLDREEALRLLIQVECPENVIQHCKAVSYYAVFLAGKIQDAGHDVDVGFIEVAALLHDIGRSKTHSLSHGIEGAKIVSGYPGLARVCERHLFAGLTSFEAKDLGLPEKDFLPETLEEKIIAHADNMMDDTRIRSIDESLPSLGKYLGLDHPAVDRVRKLALYINSLIKV